MLAILIFGGSFFGGIHLVVATGHFILGLPFIIGGIVVGLFFWNLSLPESFRFK
jgi:hypothetical protein